MELDVTDLSTTNDAFVFPSSSKGTFLELDDPRVPAPGSVRVVRDLEAGIFLLERAEVTESSTTRDAFVSGIVFFTRFWCLGFWFFCNAHFLQNWLAH